MNFATKITFTILIAILLVLGICSSFLFETNNAGYSMIVQAPISGELTVYTKPGLYWQGGGTVTRYKQVATITFGDNPGEDASVTAGPIEVRFNDSGKASISGNARFELPSDTSQILEIHRQYRSYDHLVTALLEKYTSDILVATASMFSSEDTYGGGRAEYLRLAQDQLESGKYQTVVTEEEQIDTITNEKRRAKRVLIKNDTNGMPLRLQNPLSKFGIKVAQLVIDRDFSYEKGILSQIEAQRTAFMNTVTARAEAQKAMQDAITAEATGKAEVTTARYRQLVQKEQATVEAEKLKEVAIIEAEKQKAVTEVEKQKAEIQAQQRLMVAELDKKAAEQTKLAQIAIGEGEAARKAAVMNADGALEQKLRAWTTVNENYANAIKEYQGAWVPTIVMGQGTTTSAANGVQDLINMLMVKSAKDLALSIGTDNGNILNK